MSEVERFSTWEKRKVRSAEGVTAQVADRLAR